MSSSSSAGRGGQIEKKKKNQIFSIHTVHNPDAASELELLKKYAPDVSPALAAKLAAIFQELRQLEQAGELA